MLTQLAPLSSNINIMSIPWNLRIISINVNGILTDMWRKLRTIHKMKYDIILMQETKLMHSDQNDNLQYRWKQISDGSAYTAQAASSQAGGVAILLSAHACTTLHNIEPLQLDTHQHRRLSLKATLSEEIVFIHTIYAPVRRSDRPQFFNDMAMSTLPGNHIVGGDFNCVMHPDLDTTGNHTIATSGTAELSAWMASISAIDVWRQQHCEQCEYTSPSGISRIDMIFASGCFVTNYSATHQPRTIGSDHLCPSLTSSASVIKHKKGHWQLPEWVAPAAAKRIYPTLQRLVEKVNHNNYTEEFTTIMKTISNQCQATHKQLLAWRKNKSDRARLRWVRAHMRATSNPTEELLEDAERARKTWVTEVENRERQKRAWAFDKHFKEAERCTRFFLQRAKNNSASIIPGVKIHGEVKHDRSSIQNEHTKFWSKLYSKTSDGTEPPPSTQNISELTNINIPQLPRSAALSLEAEITEDEIVQQIHRLPCRKAAGKDGLKAELFKLAPRLWAKSLLPIFQDVMLRQGELPKPFRVSIIILLHKKGCTLQPPNYRPIALLNVIAKILSGVHCARLRRVLHTVIPHEQTGFVPNRSITENIILLTDAIHYASRHHPSSIILALDFEKAYDRIQWNVMVAVLRKMGFGQRFITTIKTMYTNRSAQLSVNGELTKTFPIQRGVLQGDPLSPALFILTCAPLYAKLQCAKHEHGIPLTTNNRAPVATFYADDTNLIAKSPESAVQLYNIAEWFCTNSGAKIHPCKCIAIPTGPAPLTLSNGIKILGPSESTTILGIPLGLSVSRQQQVGRVITKMMEKGRKWAHVGRTIEGRVTVIQATILSTLWYVMAVLPTIPAEASKIQAIVNNFLNGKEQGEWGDKAARGNMSNKWFYRHKAEGGWGLSPVTRTLRCRKLALIRGFINDMNNDMVKPWQTFIIHMLKEHMAGWCEDWSGVLFWKGEQKQGEFGVGDWNAVSPWWQDAWKEWLRLKCTPKENSLDEDQLASWPIWNNRILAENHGIKSPLYSAFKNASTRAQMAAIRKLGFTTFRCFRRANGNLMTGNELYTRVTVSASVHGVDSVITNRVCKLLIRYVTAMWANASRKWLRHTTQGQPPNKVTWISPAIPERPFSSARNATISKILRASEPQNDPPQLIKLNNTPITLCWKSERKLLDVLAPSRRDLMRRLSRNALPVGIKRIHWDAETQTNCMLCESGSIESTEHLLWSCSFATETWGNLTIPWRNDHHDAVTWKDALVGLGVKLGHRKGVVIERLWTIIRVCVMRTVWLERNRRYFYPDSPTRTPTFRRNQAMDDIRAHVESWIRRAEDSETANVIDAVNYLKLNEVAYNVINTTTTTDRGDNSST